jgi:oxygen-independent coproporphyrinogen-3 oxidase
VIRDARANGFKSISVDLIYGLPHQTVIGFNRTLERVLAMDPDRLSIYNYAHLPSLFKPQRRIAEADLPSGDTKMQILALAIKKLTEAGYVYIGMDHFAKPNDELAVAQRQGRCTATSRAFDLRRLRHAVFRHLVDQQGRPSYSQNVKTQTSTTTASTRDAAVFPRHRADRRRPAAPFRSSGLCAIFDLSIESFEAPS